MQKVRILLKEQDAIYIKHAIYTTVQKFQVSKTYLLI